MAYLYSNILINATFTFKIVSMDVSHTSYNKIILMLMRTTEGTGGTISTTDMIAVKKLTSHIPYLWASFTTGQMLLTVATIVWSLLVDYSKALELQWSQYPVYEMITMGGPKFAVRWVLSFLKCRQQGGKLRSSYIVSVWVGITVKMPQYLT